MKKRGAAPLRLCPQRCCTPLLHFWSLTNHFTVPCFSPHPPTDPLFPCPPWFRTLPLWHVRWDYQDGCALQCLSFKVCPTLRPLCIPHNPLTPSLHAQRMVFPKPSHSNRSPNRKDALLNWDSPKICIRSRWNPESQTHAQNMLFPKQSHFNRSPNRKDAF